MRKLYKAKYGYILSLDIIKLREIELHKKFSKSVFELT